MTDYEYNLFKALNSENPDSWGLVEDCNSSWMFGTKDSIELKGKYLYVYDDDGYFPFLNKFDPDKVLTIDGGRILLYELNKN